MSPLNCALFPDLSALVSAVDEHAAVRLPLLARAEAALASASATPLAERLALADKTERWRYHLLQRGEVQADSAQRRLINALDQLAAALRNRKVERPSDLRSWLRPGEPRQPLDWALEPSTALEDAAARARRQTRQSFAPPASHSTDLSRGWRMRLYAPLYVSSYCINYCHYCHFRYPNELPREHLSLDAVLAQADYLARRGFRRLLLVAGDYPQLTSTSYFVEIVRALAKREFHLAVEIAPRSTREYEQLAEAGVRGVTLYQETYDPAAYSRVHERGTKSWYDWRLEGLARAADAGIRQLGLGILLGLAPPHEDVRALASHADYLLDRFPNVSLAFSLPRLHEAPQPFIPPYRVDDETFVRLYCGLRLSFPKAELVLSTRERPELRDRLANICITQMSAESCTAPGGYGGCDAQVASGGQFPVHDRRTAADMAERLTEAGFQVHF